MGAERVTFRGAANLFLFSLSWLAAIIVYTIVLTVTTAFAAHAAKPECSPQAASPAESVGMVAQRVYRIMVQADRGVSWGSGFLVSGQRIVATNYHVVDGGRVFHAGYIGADGTAAQVELRVLAYFPQKDLALLEAGQDLPGKALPLAMQLPDYATDLYAIGFPAAADVEIVPGASPVDENFFRPTVLKGSISRIMTGPMQLPHRLQLQTSLSPGFSGGPLVDQHGFTIGISTAFNQKVSDMSYGVPAIDLVRMLGACGMPQPRTDPGCDLLETATQPVPVKPATAEEKARMPNETDMILLKRAYEMLRYGDVAGARSTFEYLAITRGLSEAYEAWATSYDLVVLDRLNAESRLVSDDRAEELYDVARKLRAGRPTAADATTAQCKSSLCALLKGANGEPVVVCSRPQG
jgi:hypothetical protein